MMDRLLDKPRVLIVDIGGFTVDYLMMRSGRADLTICDSLENGVILLYNRIRTKANSEFDILLEETDIDGILKDGESAYAPAVVSLVEKLAQDFVNDLANSLRERMLDLMSGMVVFVGGGAILLRRQIEASGKVGNAVFVEDINANTKGYEFLYKMETPDIAVPQTVDRAALEEIVTEILSRRETISQTGHKQTGQEGHVTERIIVRPEKKSDGAKTQKEMDQATRSLIADTMSAFRSS